ncbi:oligopeptide transport system ATP-binding protein [Virgibacillus subterraneus]|uniref:Oligopeptide transport system ATP-binding protein n=1 Tax=Virgibacillus subterraneus TaxID=621109 RepID=A0A1H9G647_9BACI|nr:oligopeptide/dipeptide ABC transporter ATP-binding protein [Virgibacillus subterraneus]SEQ45490.1 oligopeptide transport system ATP-binding protein [Virgibacillus subterraneus]
MEKEIKLEIKELKKYYPVLKGAFKKVVGQVKAVDGVSFSVNKGETFGIVGESGCGKTTLGKCLVNLQNPSSGELLYNDTETGVKNALNLSKKESFKMRKKIQIVFQDPYSSLNPLKTVYSAFEEPLKIHKMGDKSKRKKIITEIFELINLKPEFMHRYPHEFSGGQRQRICIARALCIEPEIIICDEPVSSLDVSVQAQILNLLKDLQEQKELTYIFIAHDLSIVEYMSDRIAVMYLGKIVELADAKLLYKTCKHPYTEALVSAIPTPDFDKEPIRNVMKGDLPSPINPPNGCSFHTRCPLAEERCKIEEPNLKRVKGSENHYVACHLVSTVEE